MYPLVGAMLKAHWAGKYVDALHKEINTFLDKDTHGVVEKFHPEVGMYVRFIQAPGDTRDEWSLMVGDIAHNYRSCLDHIAWQLAIAASQSGNPEDYWKKNQIQFPIFKSRREYLGKKNRNPAKNPVWRLDGPLPDHARLLRRCQPYLRRNAPASHPLWHLHELSNIDKHQVLHTTFVDLSDGLPPAGRLAKRITDPETGELLEMVYEPPPGLPGVDMEVKVSVGGPSEGEVHLKGGLPFQIEISQPGTVLNEQPVLRLVDGIRIEVETVLAVFVALLHPPPSHPDDLSLEGIVPT